MTFVQALKQDSSLRISNGYKWIVWNKVTQEWEIYQRTPHRPSELYKATDSEDEAAKCFFE